MAVMGKDPNRLALGAPCGALPPAALALALAVACGTGGAPEAAPAPQPERSQVKREPPPVVPQLPPDQEHSLGTLRIRTVHNAVRHTHGGSPATIGGFKLEVEQTGDQPIELAVTRVEWLNAHCRSETWREPEPLESAFVHVDDVSENMPLGTPVSVPPGVHRLRITWPRFEEYQSCNRFAVRVHMRAAGQELELEAPFEVMRMEPRRAR